MSAYLDTHVAVWLHDGLVEKLTNDAKRHIEEHDLLISPMVLLELEYLHARKRIGIPPTTIYAYLSGQFAVTLCTVPFSAVILESLGVNWTSDPFDRIIVAQAKTNSESPLITADAVIRKNYLRAVW